MAERTEAQRAYDVQYYAEHHVPAGTKRLPQQNPVCEIDGLLVRRHAKCSECAILMGPGHLVSVIAPVCQSCVDAGEEWKRWRQ